MQTLRDGIPVISIPASAFNLEGFRAWATSDDYPQCGRITFLHQEILIDMSPEEYQTHGLVKNEVARVISNLNRKERLGQFFPDRTLVTNATVDLSTEPDGTFAMWEGLDSGRVRLVPREDHPDRYYELLGAPDWVMEVVSESSEKKDTDRLWKTYFRAGISEYWLIDARREELQFTIYVRGPKEYVPTIRQKDWQQSPVFGRSFRLKRKRNERGFWEYTLQVKKT